MRTEKVSLLNLAKQQFATTFFLKQIETQKPERVPAFDHTSSQKYSPQIL